MTAKKTMEGCIVYTPSQGDGYLGVIRSIDVHDTEGWPFVVKHASEDIKKLLKDKEKWPVTLIEFEGYIDDTDGKRKTENIRLSDKEVPVIKGNIAKFPLSEAEKHKYIGLIKRDNGVEYRFAMKHMSSGIHEQKLLKQPDKWKDVTVTFEIIDDMKTAKVKLQSERVWFGKGQSFYKLIFTGSREETDRIYYDILEKLSEKALEERWYYGSGEKCEDTDSPSAKIRKKFPVLANYLNHTVAKLQSEGNVIRQGNKYLAFNTGLVDKQYRALHCVLEEKEKYHKFLGFGYSGETGVGKILTSNFKEDPKKANYFESPEDLIYRYDEQHKAKEVFANYDHIIRERIDRIPLHFWEETFPGREDIIRMVRMKSFDELSKLVEHDSKIQRDIQKELENAVKLALKKIEWNFKTAIPMWFTTEDKLSLLLPLALCDGENVDLALVVDYTEAERYQGHTIIPLEWAYNNARLITRPDSEWLKINDIKQVDAEEDNDE